MFMVTLKEFTFSLNRTSFCSRWFHFSRKYSSIPSQCKEFNVIGSSEYAKDSWTNINSFILSVINRKLYLQKYHPLALVKQRIINFIYSSYVNRSGNPLFSVYEHLNPVVTLEQNFDSLLVPDDHPSRKPSDSFYLNSQYMLRAHTSCHQRDLIRTGLDNFLVVGDVYRRDEIDSTHYPVFHQVEGVRLCSQHQVFRNQKDADSLHVFENGTSTAEKQECHTLEAVKLMEYELKECLERLVQQLFGKDVKYRWTDTFFPFTHPSWELEIYHKSKWLEILGCGIVNHGILKKAGAEDKIGWAFGLGLERIAMKLYNIPDIRLFWSNDSGFLNQFQVDDIEMPITYKPISVYPQCKNDISFWIPHNFEPNNFYDLVRRLGGNMIEQVEVIDRFWHPKKQRMSHCYRITYRHMERTLTQDEVNIVHKMIENTAAMELNVEIR